MCACIHDVSSRSARFYFASPNADTDFVPAQTSEFSSRIKLDVKMIVTLEEARIKRRRARGKESLFLLPQDCVTMIQGEKVCARQPRVKRDRTPLPRPCRVYLKCACRERSVVKYTFSQQPRRLPQSSVTSLDYGRRVRRKRSGAQSAWVVS